MIMTVSRLKRTILAMIDARISKFDTGYYIDVNSAKNNRYDSLKEARLRIATNPNIPEQYSNVIVDIINSDS